MAEMTDGMGTVAGEPEVVIPKEPDPKDKEISDMKMSLHQLSSQLDAVTNMLAMVSKQNGNGVVAPAAIQEVTDEELEQALASGMGAGQTVKKLMAAMEERLLRTHINPLRDQGMGAIAGLTAQAAQGEMPHYKRYKKEIDEYVGHLQPELRLNPQAYILAHNAVVGGHMEELMQEDRAVRARQAAQGGDSSPGVSGVRKTEKGEKVPSAVDLGGEEASSALQMIGQDEDGFAKKLGYKNWAAYMKETEQYA
jgi:hypothetical protein